MFNLRACYKNINTRAYITDVELGMAFKKSQVSRVSVYDPRANELITAIKESNYKKAATLVLKEGVNVNGHDKYENTSLTDAAKRGDCQAIKFLIEKLAANVNASCDCPLHKTALHYSAENNHKDSVELLLKLGANPNVKDARKYKPSQLTTCNDIKVLLFKYEISNPLLTLKKSQSITNGKQ